MYWLEIVLWEFWAWKSFYTHRSITKFFNRKTIKIWNYSSPDFDLQFRSTKDFVKILTAIYEYKKDPKNVKQKIVIVVDEAPIYFWSRNFKNFPKELLAFLVQLRKLNVQMIVIAQDLKMLDINFRRLCYNVKKYYKMLDVIRMYKNYELLSEDANLNDPVNTIMSKPRIKIWPSWTVKIFWITNKFFGSSLYDTIELIIPYFDIVDDIELNKLFPNTTVIKNSKDYARFVIEKSKAMLELIENQKKNRKKYILKLKKKIKKNK